MSLLPNFLIIGAAKAGTTSLCHYLSQHPEIYISPEKEPRFFSPEFYTRDNSGLIRSQIRQKPMSLEEYYQLFKDVKNEVAIGEASTEYLYYPETAQRIKNLIPKVKLIAILRDPVERAFSAYCYQLRDGCETLSFERAIEEETSRLQQNWRPGWLYIRGGYYYSQLKPYFNLFSQEQMRIYLFSDFQQNPSEICQDIFDFLNVEPNFIIKDLSVKNISEVPKSKAIANFLRQKTLPKSLTKRFLPNLIYTNTSKKVKSILFKPKVPLDKKLRKKLSLLFEKEVLSLEKEINRDLSKWLSY